MRCFALAAAVALLTSCTYRGAYQADLVVENQRAGCVRYEGDIDTSGYAVACALTAIFYGGACWAYAAMPHDAHVADLRQRAEQRLGSPTGYRLAREDARELEDWSGGSDDIFVLEKNVQTCDSLRVHLPGN